MSVPEMMKAARAEVHQKILETTAGVEKFLQNAAGKQPKEISANTTANQSIANTPAKKQNALQKEVLQETASTDIKTQPQAQPRQHAFGSSAVDRFLSATSSPKRESLSAPKRSRMIAGTLTLATSGPKKHLLEFPVYDEDALGIPRKFQITLVKSNNDDDFETGEVQATRATEYCWKEALEGIEAIQELKLQQQAVQATEYASQMENSFNSWSGCGTSEYES